MNWHARAALMVGLLVAGLGISVMPGAGADDAQELCGVEPDLQSKQCVPLPGDRDGDGWPDFLDNCPDDANLDQRSTVPNGKGDVCDALYVQAGGSHSCAFMYNGSVKCWGSNSHGQADEWDGGLASEPFGDFLSAGGRHTCIKVAFTTSHGTTNAGNVECWGDNTHGQAADYTGGDADLVSAGGYHTCVLVSPSYVSLTLGEAYDVDCYGLNSSGQAADYAGGDATWVSAGGTHTCAVLVAGNVDCWGENTYGQAADYTGGDADAVSAGGHHTCARVDFGNVECWGQNTHGQAADYTGGDAWQVSAGGLHTCVLTHTSNVDCWGDNTYGQAADYTGGDATWVSAGDWHTCISRQNPNSLHPEVFCWGRNDHGQAGGSRFGPPDDLQEGALHYAEEWMDAVKDCPTLGTGCESWMARYGEAPNLEGPPLTNIDYNAGRAVATSGSLVFMAGQTFHDWPLQVMDVFVAAYDAATGAHQWTTTYDGVTYGSAVHLASISSTRLVLAWDDQVRALNPTTGAQAWSGTMSSIVVGLEAVPGGASVAVLTRGTGIQVSLLDAGTGSTDWSTSVTSPGNDLSLQPVMSPLAASADHIYVTVGWSGSFLSFDSRFATFAYDASDGSEAWSRTFKPSGESAWPRVTVTDGSAVYVTGMSWPSLDPGGSTIVSMATVAFDGSTGVTLWSALHKSADAPWDRPVAMEFSSAEDRLFVLADATGPLRTPSRLTTLAYSPVNGTLEWASGFKSPTGDQDDPVGLTVSNGRVFVTSVAEATLFPGSENGWNVEVHVVAYDASTGNATAWMRETGVVPNAITSVGGSFFLTGSDHVTGALLAAYPDSLLAGPPVVPTPVIPV